MGLQESNMQEVRLATVAALAKLGSSAKHKAFTPLLAAVADRDDDSFLRGR